MAQTKIKGSFIESGADPIVDFRSTGIDDNATVTTITLNNQNRVIIGAGSASNTFNVQGTSRSSGNTYTEEAFVATGNVEIGGSLRSLGIVDESTALSIFVNSLGWVGVGDSNPSNNFVVLGNANVQGLFASSYGGTGFLDDDTMATATATSVASSESIKAYVDSQVTAQDLDITTPSGSANVDLDTQVLAFLDGNGTNLSHTGTTITITVNSTVANTSKTLDFFSSTTSDQLNNTISDSSGNGRLIFGNSPTVNNAIVSGTTSFNLLNTIATSLNFGGAAQITMGADGTGTTTIRNAILDLDHASAQLQIASTKVVGTRETGWTAATGLANTATFNTQDINDNDTRFLAQHVKSIIDALITHGLIGT